MPRQATHQQTAKEGARHQIVIIGSGFGGLFAAKALRKADADVTVIAKTGYHLFQPLLYQVATGILSEGEVAPATREVLNGQKNARVLLGNVTQIDVAAGTVTSVTPVGEKVTRYDSLIVAAGAGQSYFGNDHFAQYAPGMKSVDDALELRGRIFGSFEMAEVIDDPAQIDEWLTFVVVGGGPTGVEMAGQIAELSHRALKHDFRQVDPSKARIILVDAVPSVLSSFGDRLSKQAEKQLVKIGVEPQLGVKVVGVDSTGVDVIDPDGSPRRIKSRTKVWAAGVSASPLGAQLSEQTGVELDRAGRVKVNPDLTVPGHPEIFVVGDMISLNNLPGVAQVAMQGGKYAAKTLRARLKGRDGLGTPFHYFDKGSMATVSRFHAVASVGKHIRLAGFIAWLMWLAVHLVYLVGFKNRVTTLLHWMVTFIGRGRSERTATEQQVFARTVMQEWRRHQEEHETAQAVSSKAG
jgi:NADH:ubiquinone reductase (H+-translocating)